jgi:transcriptional regulator with XRE-family HTH domain
VVEQCRFTQNERGFWVSGIRFGEYLGQLLKERGCSGARLANLVGIDPALVYRWLRNEAVPKLDTTYCDEIAQNLQLSTADVRHLKEAQVYSLSNPTERRPKARSSSAAVERLLRQAGPPAAANGSSPALFQPLAPRQSGVVWGRLAVLEAIISLLESLPPLQRHQSNTIMMTFQGAEDAFEDFPEQQERLTKALLRVMQRGWHIRHIWRLDQDARRSILLIEHMLRLLGTGRYQPHYIAQTGTLAPAYDLLIVPKTAAMLFLATQNPRRDDAALLTHDPEQIELIRTHFDQLQTLSQPLAQSYLPEEMLRNWQAYAEAENQPGGRFAVKDGFTFLTEPPRWYQPDGLMSQILDFSGPDLASALEHQRRRHAAFQANISAHPYRDISSRRSIEQMAQQGNVPHNDRYPLGFRLPPAARREQIERAIHLLKTHQHYELALIDEEEEQFIPTEMFWEVVGQQTVLMLCWSTDMGGKDVLVELIIHEPTIVHAFHDYFAELWDRINPAHKDKTQVIAWLEHQIALLSASVS